MPIGLDALNFVAFSQALVSSLSKHIRLFATDLRAGPRHVIDVAGCADHG